ncbi:MAG TPA: hypothetical protein VG963_14320, partial [Polyangiaceae bacterium]|nr:hypothetical protein [Polyangiaceae bacterium]
MNTRDPNSMREDSGARGDDGAVEPVASVEGERGIPSVNRIRSIQSRVTGVLAVGFVSLFALGLLAWYYTHEWARTRGVRERAASQ